MLVKILFGKEVVYDISPLRIRRKCFDHFECENYSEILHRMCRMVEKNRKKKILSFFTRRIYPRYLRYATIQVGCDTYRVKINYPYSVSVVSGNAFKFFYDIAQVISEGRSHGKED